MGKQTDSGTRAENRCGRTYVPNGKPAVIAMIGDRIARIKQRNPQYIDFAEAFMEKHPKLSTDGNAKFLFAYLHDFVLAIDNDKLHNSFEDFNLNKYDPQSAEAFLNADEPMKESNNHHVEKFLVSFRYWSSALPSDDDGKNESDEHTLSVYQMRMLAIVFIKLLIQHLLRKVTPPPTV